MTCLNSNALLILYEILWSHLLITKPLGLIFLLLNVLISSVFYWRSSRYFWFWKLFGKFLRTSLHQHGKWTAAVLLQSGSKLFLFNLVVLGISFAIFISYHSGSFALQFSLFYSLFNSLSQLVNNADEISSMLLQA